MPQKFEIGTVYPWSVVASVHRSRNGIYQKNGRLVSLLTDLGRINPCYPDFHGGTDDTFFYTGSGRRGDQKPDAANRALLSAAGTGHAVPLFNKLGSTNGNSSDIGMFWPVNMCSMRAANAWSGSSN